MFAYDVTFSPQEADVESRRTVFPISLPVCWTWLAEVDAGKRRWHSIYRPEPTPCRLLSTNKLGERVAPVCSYSRAFLIYYLDNCHRQTVSGKPFQGGD